MEKGCERTMKERQVMGHFDDTLDASDAITTPSALDHNGRSSSPCLQRSSEDYSRQDRQWSRRSPIEPDHPYQHPYHISDVDTAKSPEEGSVSPTVLRTITCSPDPERQEAPISSQNSNNDNCSKNACQSPVNSNGHQVPDNYRASSKQYDLTPIMRNTTASTSTGKDENAKGDQLMANAKHEHLAFPLDLNAPSDNFRNIGPTITRGDGLLMGISPAVRRRHLLLKRAQSLSIATVSPLQQYHTRTSYLNTEAESEEEEEQAVQRSRIMEAGNTASKDATLAMCRSSDPAPLLPRYPVRKYYSFSNTQQYKKEVTVSVQEQHPENEIAATVPVPSAGLVPYQPSRRHEDLTDQTGLLIPQEELNRIFTNNAKQEDSTGRPPNEVTSNPVGSDDLQTPFVFQATPIPLEDRQWSIPSLHLAHHLNASASFTTADTTNSITSDLCHEEDDDEESLLRFRVVTFGDVGGTAGSVAAAADARSSVQDQDDASSWTSLDDSGSSRSSSSHMWVTTEETTATTTNVRQHQEQAGLMHQVGVTTRSSYSTSTPQRQQVIQKRLEKEQQRRRRRRRVTDWLESLKADESIFAEAASSKFLTGGRQGVQ